MMKFILTNRRADGLTQEQFDFEWGVIHVAIMITTPSTLKVFRRYVQCYPLRDVDPALAPFPPHAEPWDGLGTLAFERFDEFTGSLEEQDYTDRIKPHHFSHPSMVLQLASEEIVHDDLKAPEEQAVKLVNFLRRREGVDPQEFQRQWRGAYASAVLSAADGAAHRYVQNAELSFEGDTFEGTAYAAGVFSAYAGVDEIWFEDLAAFERFGREASATLRAAAEPFAEHSGSFSMVVTERLRFQSVRDPSGGASFAWIPPGVEVHTTDGQWAAPMSSSASS
jgi:EthD domain